MRQTESQIVTEEQVRMIPIPAATKTFQPVRNGEFLDMVSMVAGRFGMNLANGSFAVTKEQQRMFGTYDLVGEEIGDLAKFKLGVRNSCDKSISVQVCFGTEVFVCTNMAFVGYADDILGIVGKVSHKHTSQVFKSELLLNRLLKSFGQFEDFKKWQVKFFDKLRDTKLSNPQASELIITAAREDVIPKTNILDVADEWKWQRYGKDEPIDGRVWHPEFKSRTAYSLMNAFTEVGKVSQRKNPVAYPQKTMGLVNFLNKYYNVN